MATKACLYEEGAAAEDEFCESSADAIVCFEAFRAAFRAWHADSPSSLDWIRRNEYAVTFLAASNLQPLRFEFDASATVSPRSNLHNPCVSAGAVTASSPTTLQLVVHAPCCGISTALTEDEQLTLAQLPRLLPFPASTTATSTATHESSNGVADLPASLTLLGCQQRIVGGLLARAHRDGCVWRDAALGNTCTGEQRREASCSVRQLLLGGPSLSITDASLVRAFCAAVALQPAAGGGTSGLNNGASGKDGSARGRYLLPRGTPPSAVRRWMEGTVRVLGSSTVSSEGDPCNSEEDKSCCGHLAHLRYTGSNVNDRILRLFFAAQKRARADSAAGDAAASRADDSGVATEVIMEYMGLLMGLYGYTASPIECSAAPDSTGIEQASDYNVTNEGGVATRGDAVAAAAGTTVVAWDGPPTFVSASNSQKGNQRTHSETVRRCGTLPAADAVALLGRHMSCRYCAHAPWICVRQEDVTTTTTTTTTTTVVTTQADRMPSMRREKTPDTSCAESEKSHEKRHAEDGDARDADAEENEEDEAKPTEFKADRYHNEEEGDEQNGGAVQEEGDAPADPDDASSRAASYTDQGKDEDEEAANEFGSAKASPPFAQNYDEGGRDVGPLTGGEPSVGESAALSRAMATRDDAGAQDETLSQSGPSLHPAGSAAPAAITTVTKAVTTTSTTQTTDSTTTITVTFSRRSTAPHEPGHEEYCPWHQLFLTRVVDTAALATAERCMDFTWAVEESEGKGDLDAEGGLDEERTAEDSTLLNRKINAEGGPFLPAELKVTGTTMTLLPREGVHSALTPEHSSTQDPDNLGGNATKEAVEVTHRTVLVFRFFQSEVERLITTWRLSDEWECLRPGQYLRHPLWRTWSTAAVLHPIHTEAADGAMEQYLRELERRMSSSTGAGERADDEEEGDNDENSSDGRYGGRGRGAAASTMLALLGSKKELLMTVGAPLYQSPSAAVNKTAETALRVAGAALRRCFGETAEQQTPAYTHRERSARAQTLLMAGLHALLNLPANEVTRRNDLPSAVVAAAHSGRTA